MPLTSKGSDQLFELPIGTGGEPFEERDLGQQTDFQSRAARAGAEYARATQPRSAAIPPGSG